MHKFALLMSSLVFASAALAQGYPSRPITMVLPYPPGGTTDAVGRLTAKRLEAALGVPVVIENKSGASGTIGSDFVRRAAPDGYTLLFNASIFVVGKSVIKAIPYDPVGDFMPLARVGHTPLVVLANPQVPVKNLAELVTAAKARPEALNFANSAAGSAGHLASIEFNRLSGASLPIVTYRGSAPALTDLVGGHVQLMIDPPAVALPQVKAGKLKALAVTSTARLASAPEIPTTAEAGMPKLVRSSWYGVWGPKRLPDDVLRRLDAAVETLGHDEEFKRQLTAIGVEQLKEGRTTFSSFVSADAASNDTLLKSVGVLPE